MDQGQTKTEPQPPQKLFIVTTEQRNHVQSKAANQVAKALDLSDHEKQED